MNEVFMKRIAKLPLGFLLIFGIVLLLVIFASFFIGSGYSISSLFKFPWVTATLWCIGATFLLSCILFFIGYVFNEEDNFYSQWGGDECDCPICTFKRSKLDNSKLERRQPELTSANKTLQKYYDDIM
jgi:hypothetical protein